MSKSICFLVMFTLFASVYGVQPSNYEISKSRQSGFGIKDIVDFLLGGGYGQYPNYPGYYPGNPGYPGQYPGQYRPPGPPGDHPGCPLCDSSVYSYCSHKQAHDACCCDRQQNGYSPYCRKYDCGYIYANTCDEYALISNCCCVDLKNAVDTPVVA